MFHDGLIPNEPACSTIHTPYKAKRLTFYIQVLSLTYGSNLTLLKERLKRFLVRTG